MHATEIQTDVKFEQDSEAIITGSLLAAVGLFTFDEAGYLAGGQTSVRRESEIESFGLPYVVHDGDGLKGEHILPQVVAVFVDHFDFLVRRAFFHKVHVLPDQAKGSLGRVVNLALVQNQFAQNEVNVDRRVKIAIARGKGAFVVFLLKKVAKAGVSLALTSIAFLQQDVRQFLQFVQRLHLLV